MLGVTTKRSRNTITTPTLPSLIWSHMKFWWYHQLFLVDLFIERKSKLPFTMLNYLKSKLPSTMVTYIKESIYINFLILRNLNTLVSLANFLNHYVALTSIWVIIHQVHYNFNVFMIISSMSKTKYLHLTH